MNNLISKQAAINAVENALDRETILYRFVRKIAISALRNLSPVQPERQWIPCSERLPEKCGVYLVSGSGRVWLCELVQMMTIRGWANDARNPDRV